MEEKIIYGGQIKFKFVEGNHSYWVAKKEKEGWGKWERVTGTTTFCGIKDKSMPLKDWVAKIMAKFLSEIIAERAITKYDIDEARALHTKRLEEAATVGSLVHDWITDYIGKKNPEMPSDKNVILGVNAFLDWVKQNKVKFLESEYRVYSKKYDYCGTIDAIATIGNKRYLIDYKTGTGLYNEVRLQTAGYQKAYEEMTGNKIVGRWVIRLEKRTPEEFAKDMDEKGKPNEKYVAFETKYLDEEKQIEKDFEAFLAAIILFRWNKNTE